MDYERTRMISRDSYKSCWNIRERSKSGLDQNSMQLLDARFESILEEVLINRLDQDYKEKKEIKNFIGWGLKKLKENSVGQHIEIKISIQKILNLACLLDFQRVADV